MAASVENLNYRRSALIRLRPLYIASALQSFVLWYAIEKPFLQEIGLSPSQMGVIVVIMSAVNVSANVPIGIAGDRSSRKHMLMLGSVGLIVASLVGGLAHGFGTYVIAAVAFGFFNAAYNGGFDSIIYDVAIEESGSGDDYQKLYGTLGIYEGAALSVSSLLGGLAAWLLEPRAAFLITVPFAIGSLIALARFREPTIHRKGEHNPSKLLSTLALLLRNKHTLAVILTSVVVTVGFSIIIFLDQLWLLELGFPLPLYGPFNALLLACIAMGGHLARRDRKRSSDLWWASAGVVAAGLLVIDNVFVVLIGQCMFTIAFMLLSISLGKRVHDATPSRVRSSVSSTVSTTGTLCFLPATLVFGHITDEYSVFTAAWMVVGIAAIAIVGIASVVATQRPNT